MSRRVAGGTRRDGTTLLRGLAGGCLLAILCPIAGGAERPVLAGPAMGTTYRVTLAAEIPGLERSAVHREIEDVLAGIDRAASTWRRDSDISRVNAAVPGEWIPVAAHLVEILEIARTVHDRSRGAFDVTVSGVTGRPVGMRHVETRREPPAVRLLVAGVAIDLGGIGPGYAVDAIGDRLAALGSAGHLVSLGGEIRGWGEAAPGEPWRVRIAAPPTAEPTTAALGHRIVDLASGQALGTSTVRPGRSPIDPRTGSPIPGPARSLTALAPTCAEADAWAVAALVLGLEPSAEGFVVAMPKRSSDHPRTNHTTTD
jgi:thiamine biosynthesis lipoprotein